MSYSSMDHHHRWEREREAREAVFQVCEWFATCANRAADTMPHPILGEVAICTPCRGIAEEHAA